MYVGPLADPWVQAEVDKAIAPYTGRLPAADVAWMRARLLEALATERKGMDLLRRARPRFVEESGEVGPDGQPSAPAAPALKTARGQGSRGR